MSDNPTSEQLISEANDILMSEPTLNTLDREVVVCGRPDCDHTEYTQLGIDKHQLNDHEPRHKEVDNYPRPASERQ